MAQQDMKTIRFFDENGVLRTMQAPVNLDSSEYDDYYNKMQGGEVESVTPQPVTQNIPEQDEESRFKSQLDNVLSTFSPVIKGQTQAFGPVFDPILRPLSNVIGEDVTFKGLEERLPVNDNMISNLTTDISSVIGPAGFFKFLKPVGAITTGLKKAFTEDLVPTIAGTGAVSAVSDFLKDKDVDETVSDIASVISGLVTGGLTKKSLGGTKAGEALDVKPSVKNVENDQMFLSAKENVANVKNISEEAYNNLNLDEITLKPDLAKNLVNDFKNKFNKANFKSETNKKIFNTLNEFETQTINKTGTFNFADIEELKSTINDIVTSSNPSKQSQEITDKLNSIITDDRFVPKDKIVQHQIAKSNWQKFKFFKDLEVMVDASKIDKDKDFQTELKKKLKSKYLSGTSTAEKNKNFLTKSQLKAVENFVGSKGSFLENFTSFLSRFSPISAQGKPTFFGNILNLGALNVDPLAPVLTSSVGLAATPIKEGLRSERLRRDLQGLIPVDIDLLKPDIANLSLLGVPKPTVTQLGLQQFRDLEENFTP